MGDGDHDQDHAQLAATMPSRKPRVVLDTDVASKLWRGKLDQSSQQKLVGVTPVLTYITLAEWWQWAHHRGWGPAKISEMRTYASNFELLHRDNEVVKTWGGCPDSP